MMAKMDRDFEQTIETFNKQKLCLVIHVTPCNLVIIIMHMTHNTMQPLVNKRGNHNQSESQKFEGSLSHISRGKKQRTNLRAPCHTEIRL